MSASSPWLAASSSTTSALDASNDIDPWSSSTTNIIDSDFLHPSTPSQQQQQQQQLRSRKSSPSFPSASTNAQVVDRHPLRSPSPGVAGPSNSNRPQAAPRRPSAVASEWKAIGAGLAGLFGGSSSNATTSSYRWPADPASSSTSKRTARQSASHAGDLIQTEDDDHANYYDDDEARKGRPINTVENTLDRLEDWFGLKQQQQKQQQQHNSTFAPSHRTAVATNNTHSTDEEQVRVLIHPVAPTDTLPSLALHYGADIQVLRKSNKLWPGDPVQIRKVIYIPVDSCKHRPPNAEIKVVPTRAGAVSSSSETANANTLVFVTKQEDEDLLTGTPTAEIPQPNMVADSLASMRVSDPASDFMPDTNKAYIDSAAPAFGTSLTRAGSLNGKQQTYPASLAPALRNLNQQQHKHQINKPASSIGGSNTPSIPASASGASSGFVPPRQPLHVAKVPADQLRFFASDKAKPNPADVGESGIDDLLALGAQQQQQQQQQHDGPRPQLSRQTSVSNVSGYRDDDEEDEWKPNTWHFGSSTNKNSNSNSNVRPNGAPESSISNHYAGWNDAPPPHAIVAKAYDGGKAYQKRQSQKSHRLLYDLAAGLPANPGAASKWARPIQFGDSLPGGEVGGGNKSGSGPIAGASKAKGGLGKLLDDTIRGRISVEAALEGALEGVRGKSSLALPQSNTKMPPPRRSLGTSRQSSYASAPPPPPPQAAPISTIDPLSTSNKARPSLTSHPSSSGLEQRRKVDWTKGKDD